MGPTSKLFEREHRFPAQRASHRLRRCASTGALAGDWAFGHNGDSNRQSVLACPHRAVPPWLDGRHPFPGRRASDRTSDPVRGEQYLVPRRVVDPLAAPLQRRRPRLRRPERLPRPRVEVQQHRARIFLVEREGPRHDYHGAHRDEDDTLDRSLDHAQLSSGHLLVTDRPPEDPPGVVELLTLALCSTFDVDQLCGRLPCAVDRSI